MRRVDAFFYGLYMDLEILREGGVAPLTTHDFENRSARRAGVLNFSIPGDFERDMPAIARWFAEHPPKDA